MARRRPYLAVTSVLALAAAAAACSGGYQIADPPVPGSVPPVCADVRALADALVAGTPSEGRTPGSVIYADAPGSTVEGAAGGVAAPSVPGPTDPAGAPVPTAPPTPAPEELRTAIDRLQPQVPQEVAAALAVLRTGARPAVEPPPGPPGAVVGPDAPGGSTPPATAPADPVGAAWATVEAWITDTCGLPLRGSRGTPGSTAPAPPLGEGLPTWAAIEAAALARNPDAGWRSAKPSGMVGDTGGQLIVDVTAFLGPEAGRQLCEDVRAVTEPVAPSNQVAVVVKTPDRLVVASGGPDSPCTAADPLR